MSPGHAIAVGQRVAVIGGPLAGCVGRVVAHQGPGAWALDIDGLTFTYVVGETNLRPVTS